MQQLNALRTGILLAAGLIGLGAGSGHAQTGDDPRGGSLLRMFNDSQHVSVRSLMGDYRFTLPREASLSLHWNNERVTIPAIDAPAGTAEAIDAITTASRPICPFGCLMPWPPRGLPGRPARTRSVDRGSPDRAPRPRVRR